MRQSWLDFFRFLIGMLLNFAAQSKKSSNSGTISRTDTDPVALYHRYKKEWDRRKIPGENDHAGLRWAIRKRMNLD